MHVLCKDFVHGIAYKVVRGQIAEADGKGHDFMQGSRQKAGKEAAGLHVPLEIQLTGVQHFHEILPVVAGGEPVRFDIASRRSQGV